MFDRNRPESLYHKNAGTLFALVPKELFPLLTAYPSQNPYAIKLLNHLAFGERTAAEALIKANPRLLLHPCGNILTPSGLVIDYPATAWEFALLSGDDRAAAMIKPYFFEIPDGEKFRNAQSERCRPHIENMLNRQPSYSLEPLINIIKSCTDAQITAALNHDTKNMSPDLLEAFTAFRAHFTPAKMMMPGMHFNYSDLLHAFEIYASEYDSLSSNGNYDRCRLVWRQVVGFIQRGLPACDRQIFARGLYYVVNSGIRVGETFEFQNDEGNFFPDVRGGGYLGGARGLGWDFGVDIFGPGGQATRGWQVVAAPHVEILCREKTSVLQNLCSPDRGVTPCYA